MQPGTLAPKQNLQDGAECAGRGRNQAEQQCRAAITGLQPECSGQQEPDREIAHRAQHPTEIVVVDVGLNDVRPCPAVAEMRDDDRRNGDECNPDGRAHRSNIIGAMRLLVAISILVVGRVSAQDIPPYVPANPVLESRSALYAQPFISPHAGWSIRYVADYYNAIEVSQSAGTPQRQTIFDAEVLQGDLWATRDLSKKLFLVVNLPLRGGYDGFLDNFLNWYHNVIGLGVPARNQEPVDSFRWVFSLPDTNVSRTKPGTFLGDLRTGVGVRFGRTQLIASVTIPTATLGDDGWTRHVIGTSLALTSNLVHTSRVALDASASAGFTPTSGALAKYQGERLCERNGERPLAVRRAAIGVQHRVGAVGKLARHRVRRSARSGGLDGLRIFATREEELAGASARHDTETLVPNGPAMDVGFTVGLRFGEGPKAQGPRP